MELASAEFYSDFWGIYVYVLTTLGARRHLCFVKSSIVKTKEISRRSGVDDEINKYLDLGWIIVDTWIVGYGDPRERIETFHAILGWIHKSIEPAYPPNEYAGHTQKISEIEGGESF